MTVAVVGAFCRWDWYGVINRVRGRVVHNRAREFFIKMENGIIPSTKS